MEKAAARARRTAAKRAVLEPASNAEQKIILPTRALFDSNELRLEDLSGCQKMTR